MIDVHFIYNASYEALNDAKFIRMLQNMLVYFAGVDITFEGKWKAIFIYYPLGNYIDITVKNIQVDKSIIAAEKIHPSKLPTAIKKLPSVLQCLERMTEGKREYMP